MKIQKDKSRQPWLFPQTRRFNPNSLLHFLRMAYLKTSGIDKPRLATALKGLVKIYTSDRQLLKKSALDLLNKYKEPEDRVVIIWALGWMKYQEAGTAIMDVLKEVLPRFDEGSAKVRMAVIEAVKNIKYLPIQVHD